MIGRIFGKKKDKDLFYARGNDRIQKNDYNGAVIMYDEALKCAPTDTTLLVRRSFAQMMSTPPRLDLALQDANTAIQHRPTDWQGWLQKGEIYLKMGNMSGAEEAFKNAIRFAQGMDKLTAQMSYANMQSRRGRASPIAGTSGTSIESTPPSLPPEPVHTPPHVTPSTRPSQSVPVVRTNDSSTGILQAPPPDVPPRYTPINNPNPTPSPQELETQLTQLQATLAVRNKGSISIRPYTTARGLDSVQTVYVGMIQLELTTRELGTPTYSHPSFSAIATNTLKFPGITFLETDCESSGYYDGRLPGTVSISGYSGEYREQQILAVPLVDLVLESTNTPPTMELDAIVDRIRSLQQLTLEDNEGLRGILGLSMLTALQSGFNSNRQRQIEAICMALNHSIYSAPTRFLDLSKTRNISNNTLGSSIGNGIGLQNFLFQILLGAELLIRLRREPATTSYAGFITDTISALMVMSDAWMQNVIIQGPNTTTPTTTYLTSSTIPSTPSARFTLVAREHQLRAEGLIRFGESLSWPYMDEARKFIESAYQDLISNRRTVDLDNCDWLFGLARPGKIFRHLIMCCLVYASPSVRNFNPAPFWANGLVVKNKSYWPRRTVLGRVLGGLKNLRSICGWIGPLPAPVGNYSGWILLNARRVNIPVPVSTTETALQSFGFNPADEMESRDTTIQSLVDPNEWIQTCPPSRPTNDSNNSVFKAIRLTEVPSATTTTTIANTSKEYQASLDFEVNGSSTSYTLYSNPIFICAPPCVGTHSMHRRQAQKYLSNVVKVADLKEAYPPSDALLIIDALGQGEEVVARAWCAERARHAVIRRDGECCFTCATKVTVGYTGLGINVLIWSR